jgi:hypothetical protein
MEGVDKDMPRSQLQQGAEKTVAMPVRQEAGCNGPVVPDPGIGENTPLLLCSVTPDFKIKIRYLSYTFRIKLSYIRLECEY